MKPTKLVKSVCGKCYKNNGWIWTGSIENKWNKRGFVDCIGYMIASNTSVVPIELPTENCLVPDVCPYKLEHLVVSQDGDANSANQEITDKFSVANKKNGVDEGCGGKPKWTLDCQKKFCYDGSIVEINTRFYPPNYNANDGGGWGGGLVEVVGDGVVFDKKYFKPRGTIDELMVDVEKYVSETTVKIHKAIKNALKDG